jgi:hypothetical protein
MLEHGFSINVTQTAKVVRVAQLDPKLATKGAG